MYLDNHSASRPCAPALDQMRSALEEYWKCSFPKMALSARDALETRYPMIYDLVGANLADSFVFTSSGAEAIDQVHWSIFLELSRKEGKCHFVTSAGEDLALLQSLQRLEDLGCYVKVAPLDASGQIDIEKLKGLIGPRTAMISISLAHGLSGAIQPIDEIAQIAKEKGALLHVDATYALGKLYAPFEHPLIDYLTFAGDRLHSVKGSGGIFAKPGRPLSPFVLGPGLDVPSVMALSAAASHATLSLDLMSLEVARLRDFFEEGILKRFPDSKALMREHVRLPNVSVISFPKVHQETLLYALQKKQLFATIGGFSMPHLSKYLISCGVDGQTAETAISFSLSRFTTQAEIDQSIQTISEAVVHLRSLSKDLFL